MISHSMFKNDVRRHALALAVTLLSVMAGACASGPAQIPDPRPLVNHAGARIRVDKDSMQAINDWVTKEQENITNDPTFMVDRTLATEEVYPWDGLKISNDTVTFRLDPRAADALLPFEIYAHLHLMAVVGRQAEWLPEAPTATGYDLERAIVSRVADAWTLGRTVFDTQPYGPLDELMYAKRAGYLDAFIFTARPDEFGEARATWAKEHPDQATAYRDWFVKTFNKEPPGLRPG